MTLPLFLAAAVESHAAQPGLPETFGLDVKYVVIQAISFLIVLAVLYKFGIKPTIAAMDERAVKIGAGSKYAEEMQAKLAAAQQESAALVKKSQVEATRIIDDARKSAKDFTDKQTQEDLRKKIIATVSDSCSDIPINNTWEDVFDNSITSRKSGWQLYGSRKPNHEAYKLTHIFEVSYDEEEDTCKIKKIDLNHFDIVNNIYELSARCTTHPKFIFKSEYLNNRPKSNPPSAMRSQTRRIGTARDSGLNSYVLEIKNQEQRIECNTIGIAKQGPDMASSHGDGNLAIESAT
jgi:hypothetical protein